MNRKSSEYLSFLQSDEKPSQKLDSQVQASFELKAKKEWYVFLVKLGAIHLFSGLITLSFCPQFGLNPFRASPHLPHIFMSYGLWACGFFCGSIFMGSGAFLRWIFLSSRDRFMIAPKGLQATLILSAVLYGSLMMLGRNSTQQLASFSIAFFLSWVVAAVLWERLSLLFMRGFVFSSSR